MVTYYYNNEQMASLEEDRKPSPVDYELSELGYTEKDFTEYHRNKYSYPLSIIENWDSSVSSLEERFKDDTNLLFMPKVDTSNVTNMYRCFQGCSSLTFIPLLDTGQVKNMSLCFSNCYSLTTIPQFNTSNVTDMDRCFSGCYNLTTIPLLDTGKVTNMSRWFYGCSSLKRIPSISFKSMGSISSAYYFIFGGSTNSKCRYILIKDIGTNPDCTTVDTTYAQVWGIADDEVTDARQSLVDSLLTYSFDRRAAGYSDCEIKLYSNVYNLLTADEITAIENKGYILTT